MIGVVLAGGASRRFGGEPKGLKMLHGVPLALHVARALAGACSQVVIEDNGDPGYAALGLQRIAAEAKHAGMGPLAGLVAGLNAAAGAGRVAFAPCDLPLVTTDIIRTLMDHEAGAFAVSASGAEPLVCVLPARALPVVEAALSTPQIPRVVEVMERIGAAGVRFADSRAFLNVNTPGELDALNAGGQR